MVDQEAALYGIEMNVAVLIDVEDDNSLVGGVVIGAKGDLAADALNGVVARNLLQRFLQIIWGKADVLGENDVAGLQDG